MTDIGNAAPTESVDAVSTPNPISTDNVDHAAKAEPEAKPEPKKATAREALEKAATKVEADQKTETKPVETKATDKPTEKPKDAKSEGGAAGDKEAKAEPVKTEAKEPQERDETGKFKAPEPVARKPHDDPPKSLNSDESAKAEWAKAPESVRAAFHRRERELEDGISQHQKRWEPLKPFDDLARQSGTDLPSALNRYVSFEVALRQNVVEGLRHIAKDMGFDLKQVAAHILGQPAPTQDQNQQTIARLEARLAQAERQLGGIGGTLQSQQAATVKNDVEAFAADKPDFEPLAGMIAEHISAGKSLQDAYEAAKTQASELAEKLGYAPAPAQTRTAPDPQTVDKGQKSISGAPTAGAEPARRKPSPSIGDAVRRAMQAAS